METEREMTRPLCKCHGIPMYHRKDRGWRCKVKQLESNRRYYERHIEDARARTARTKMRLRGDRGAWMDVLRITKVTEMSDGA